MRLSYSTENVNAGSFMSLCRLTDDYSYAGFEIYDAIAERRDHADSILRSDKSADAKRWLRNRFISVCALTYPTPLDGSEGECERLLKYVDMASGAGIENVIVSFGDEIPEAVTKESLPEAIKRAEGSGVMILFETVGVLSETERVLDLIRSFSSASLGVSWNIRQTYFVGGESAETTIKTLGAYINYVRIGDRKDGSDVLIGEGELPVGKFIGALRSLNYEGCICVDGNSDIKDYDIVLTHFAGFMAGFEDRHLPVSTLPTNRDGSGTFPWKKYDVMNMTFSEVLDVMARTYPDQLAFKYTTLDYTRTYSQFKRDVDAVAASLISLGVKPGYHVAIWATNVPSWYLTFWATTKIGAVLVTVNTAYKIHEIEYLLRQSDTHTLVMIEGSKECNYKEIMQKLCPELQGLEKGRPLYSKNLPFLRNVITDGFSMEGCLNWDEMLDRGESVPLEEVNRRASQVRPQDVCNMQYTSGTTGFPKGVMLTHSNIVNNGKIIGDRMDLSTADRMMVQVPMFHCFGMVLSMTSTMTHGGTLCPMPYFSPKSSLACINEEKITCFNGVPTMFIAMFGHPDFEKTDFSYMRTGIMAGANCPPELMKRAAAEMNMREIISVYGQTEASPGCTMGEVNETLELRTETVGSAFPGVECKVIDPETGEELPDGCNGEFVARGYNIMKGYYKMPEATAQTIDSEGWLHSGDICCRTPEGYYKVTGRLKDMIIRGGENIYPREIEEFYLTNPKVRDVQVIGVPDEKYGEEACAWIILHDRQESDEAEMRAYGEGRMARHKVPRYFMFVREFPMNAAGKILKYKMKEQSEELLGLKK